MAHGFQFLRWPAGFCISWVPHRMGTRTWGPAGGPGTKLGGDDWCHPWLDFAMKNHDPDQSLMLISVNDQFLAIDLGKSLINDIDFYGPWLPAMFDWGYFIGISMGFRTSTSLKWCLAPCLNMGAIGPYCHLNLRTRWWWYGWNTGGGNHQNDGKKNGTDKGPWSQRLWYTHSLNQRIVSYCTVIYDDMDK